MPTQDFRCVTNLYNKLCIFTLLLEKGNILSNIKHTCMHASAHTCMRAHTLTHWFINNSFNQHVLCLVFLYSKDFFVDKYLWPCTVSCPSAMRQHFVVCWQTRVWDEKKGCATLPQITVLKQKMTNCFQHVNHIKGGDLSSHSSGNVCDPLNCDAK